jgi:hypothetical protein
MRVLMAATSLERAPEAAGEDEDGKDEEGDDRDEDDD